MDNMARSAIASGDMKTVSMPSCVESAVHVAAAEGLETSSADAGVHVAVALADVAPRVASERIVSDAVSLEDLDGSFNGSELCTPKRGERLESRNDVDTQAALRLPWDM
jgi:hypothetical protein